MSIMQNPQRLQGAVDAFTDRMAATPELCAHEMFPEIATPAHVAVIDGLLSGLVEAVERDATAEELYSATEHALIIASAWARTLGALDALDDDGSDYTPKHVAFEIPGDLPDWLPDWQ